MGCFDAKCSVSDLPISWNDDVVMLYIANTNFYKTNIDNDYESISLPIKGKYNDYGGIESIVESEISEWFLHQQLLPKFKNVCLPSFRASELYEIFEHTIHMNSVSGEMQPLPDEWTCGNWGNCVFEKIDSNRDHDCYELKKGNGSRVSKMFVHRSVYNKLIEIGKNYTSWNVKEPISIDMVTNYINTHKEQVKSDNLETQIEDLSSNEKLSKEDMHKLGQLLKLQSYGFDSLYYKSNVDSQDPSRFFSSFIDSEPSESPRGINRFVAHLIRTSFVEFWKTNNVKQEQQLLNTVLEYFYFHIGLRQINKRLQPLYYPMAQHQDNDSMKLTIEFLNICKTIQDEKLKNYEDE